MDSPWAFHSEPSADQPFKVTAWWDVPLQSFLAVVEDRSGPVDDLDEFPTVWVGAEPGRPITDIGAFAHRLSRFCTLPRPVIERLERERRLSPEPTLLQKQIRSMMSAAFPAED